MQKMKDRRLELAAIAAFVVAQLLAPLMVGEVYPFTISPMFSDQPSCYAIYQVFDESGRELDASQFGLHLVYDGNPPGFGVGVRPLPTVHAFGEVCDCDTISGHVLGRMQQDDRLPRVVRVRQKLVHGGGEQLDLSTTEWTIRADSGQ